MNVSIFIPVFLAVIGVVAIVTVIVWFGMRLLVKSKPGITATFVAAAVLAIVLALAGLYALPRFQTFYNGICVELPVHTQALVSMRYVLMLPLLCIGVISVSRSNEVTDSAFYLRFLAAESVLIVLVLWSMYAPIFNLWGHQVV